MHRRWLSLSEVFWVLQVDQKGNHIYVEIPGSEAEKFKDTVKEGGVYVFRKFVVSANKSAYRPFPSSYMVRFTPWTTVIEKKDLAEKFPRHVFTLVSFEELADRVGKQEFFVDTIGAITGVSKIAYVRLPANQNVTAKRVITLKDLRKNQMNLVLWGSKAMDFDADAVYSVGQDSPVVAIFVGMLMKSYNNENTLSGGSACKWYINDDIPEIDKFFERMSDSHEKISWISAGEQPFRCLKEQRSLQEKTVADLKNIDPWEFENTGFLCTVTISKINQTQPWWFSSCTKCHKAAVLHGSEYKCSGGCPSKTAEPKYRLCLIGTDGTSSAEFVLFGPVARQVIGKPVMSLLRSTEKNHGSVQAFDKDHILPELAALVSQKYTFVVSVTQKSLTQQNMSFQVNAVNTFHGKQSVIPPTSDTKVPSTFDVPAEFSSAANEQLATKTSCSENDVHGACSESPLKKPRLTRRPIPAKKSLHFTDETVNEKDTEDTFASAKQHCDPIAEENNCSTDASKEEGDTSVTDLEKEIPCEVSTTELPNCEKPPTGKSAEAAPVSQKGRSLTTRKSKQSA